MLNVFQEGHAKEVSLTNSFDMLEEWFGIKMSKQSLDERFDGYSVDFMRLCFHKVLGKELIKPSSVLGSGVIQKAILTDFASFQISKDLAAFYRGSGVSSSEAVVKIHYSYVLTNGRSIDIQVVDGCSSDNSYEFNEHFQIESGVLYLRDLGYYGHQCFQSVDEAGGYFLRHCKSNTRACKLGEELLVIPIRHKRFLY